MATSGSNGHSTDAVISTDGSTIAFVSDGTNLVSGQSAGSVTNVFLFKNDGTGTVSLVSGVNGSTTLTGDGNSDSPVVNADGSYIAFRSDATNLVGSDNAGSNIYEFNTQTRAQVLVSAVAGSPLVGAGGSSDPVISPDGHLVTYTSTAGNLVPSQSGLVGVENVFVWLRQNGANILVSGQNGSPVVTGNADSVHPLLAGNQFPAFSSLATNLITGLGGTSVTYLNTLVQVSLFPNLIADGSLPGTTVGRLTITSLLVGQYLPPVYHLSPASSSSFALAARTGGEDLLTRFLASYTGQGSYQVTVFVDVGFGDRAATFQVYVSPSVIVPPPVIHPLSAHLVPVRVGKKKATRLMVDVFYADTGALKEQILSPFQKPAYANIQMMLRDSNGDGVPDVLVFTAKKGRKKVSRMVTI
jgi:hypothetical protein